MQRTPDLNRMGGHVIKTTTSFLQSNAIVSIYSEVPVKGKVQTLWKVRISGKN